MTVAAFEPYRAPGPARAAAVLGMWVFVMSEAMLFGGLFLVYVHARLEHGDAFVDASRHLKLWIGAGNTAVLLTSSFAAALANHYAAIARWTLARRWLAVTFALGLCFLAAKGVEYALEYREGLAPVFGAPFGYEGAPAEAAELFFNLYFAMSALHAAHMAAGLVVMAWAVARWRRIVGARRHAVVHGLGLYWHFVDIVWVFLFPLLYLVR